MKILVIDDDEDIRTIVEYSLSANNHKVLVAQDGFEGIRIAEKESPDLVLLDVMMPEMDGIEVCERLKSEPKTEKIPIIMVSAKSQLGDIDIALKAGANDYLTKPFAAEKLNDIIQSKLERIRSGSLTEFFPDEKDIAKKVDLMEKELEKLLAIDYRERIVQTFTGKWGFKRFSDNKLIGKDLGIRTKEDALFYALHDYYGIIHSLRIQLRRYSSK